MTTENEHICDECGFTLMTRADELPKPNVTSAWCPHANVYAMVIANTTTSEFREFPNCSADEAEFLQAGLMKIQEESDRAASDTVH